MSDHTKQKVSYIMKALDVAEVSMIDFARITGIRRETLYRWKTGGNITDQLRLKLAYNAAIRLEKACRLGELPLRDKLKKEARQDALVRIVARMATK